MIGFSIKPCLRKVPSKSIEAFRGLPVAIISDAMSRMTGCGLSTFSFHTGARMIGTAITVNTRAGDNLMVHKAIQMASAGDVIVVDAGGELSNAIIGELMASQCLQRRLGGIVIHGAIRDSADLRKSGLPVFAAGVTHRGPFKDGPGTINETISIGNMVVSPGDLICGDTDGVVSIRYEDIDDVFGMAVKKQEEEEALMKEIRTGTEDNKWIDALLLSHGYKSLK